MKLALILIVALASATLHADVLSIFLDRSGSNPLLVNQSFARQAAIFAAERVEALDHGDVVELRNFGDRSEAANIRTLHYQIDRQNKPSRLAKVIASYIFNIPQEEGNAQSSTNLVAIFELSDFDCASGETVLLITDGLEASEYISGDDFKSGSSSLPEPDADLTGCEVLFYGLGIGWRPSEVKNVRNGWRTYFDKTGASFTSITP